MRKMIFTAALAAILAITIAACGGDDGEGAEEERLHPVLWDAIYLQIQEGQEYITMWSPEQNRHLSDRINAIHQGDYELQHMTSDEWGDVLMVFRKIAHPEESHVLDRYESGKLTNITDYRGIRVSNGTD